MLTRLDLRGKTGDLRSLLPRPSIDSAGPQEAVRTILAAVAADGDSAVRDYTRRFDGALIGQLRVPAEDLATALAGIDPALRSALEESAASVEAYHRHQMPAETTHARRGVTVRAMRRAVDRAGLYIPGGRAGYPSTVIMSAVPARVAGVDQVVMCVPPGPDGRVNPATLAAAALVGVDEVYRIGGAQAVAAMAYGTESVAPVDVIVGPGNVYVAVAKRQVAAEGRVGVPSAFAGPSEVVVVADDSVPTLWVATDVIVQAEHGPDGLAWLVTWLPEVATTVSAEVARLVAASPRRTDLETTLAAGGYAVLVDDPAAAMAVANTVAPEHLELLCRDAQGLTELVRHAGAVFCGALSPASIGDYVAGPSHVLPTFGSARYAAGLGVDSFLRTIHAVTVDADGLAWATGPVATLADNEGLPAHADSVRIRQASHPGRTHQPGQASPSSTTSSGRPAGTRP
ncbi:MAG: histidinol dehydrogenase [Acidimicrobiales bacterium]